MRLLVVGAAGVDAGKTTFSTGLAASLDAAGFKPRAGNDYWFDHDDYRRAVAERRLYGKDARRLAAVGDEIEERINPVHRLWRPSPGPSTGLLGRERREFVCDRVTIDGTDAFVVNGTADVPASVRESLPLEEATVVESLPAFDDVMADLHRRALDALAERVAAADRAVVESYADIALPLREFVPDAVAVVEPGRARVYDGDRYAKACAVVSGSAYEGRLETRVGNVVDLLDPRAQTYLPALASEARGDPASVADAYEPAYEALMAAARE
ncbi:ATPase [Halomarina pelagica]|uniref:ATPase n=1 Tax=Halomarina pelagica TaxID=2961599 RepID=UPI0020C328EE|nr:ATPase [Halomarina sp. BND7]